MHETEDLEQRHSPLAMSSGEFRLLGHQMVDRVADFLDSLPGRLVTTGESPQQIRQALDAGRTLPKGGSDPAKLIGRAPKHG
jgi:aromatic-L-amino-acid/L-tryptophan decarboxylase